MAESRTFSGARARFKINGQKVGFAGGVSGEESIDYEPVNVLDKLEVEEYVPTAYRVSLNAQIFRVIGSSLKQLGIFPIQSKILTSGALSAVIEDSVTGKTMAVIEQCKAQSHSFDINARGIVSENVSFNAIRMRDESETDSAQPTQDTNTDAAANAG